MKVAVIHDWLTSYAGAEKVLTEILDLWPSADLFVVVDFLQESDRKYLHGRTPKVSFIQSLPFSRKKYRSYLPLMPIAVEQFDLSSYELIISSSHAVAKGVLVGPDQKHVCYIHSPIRYAWDLQHQYLAESGLSFGLKGIFAKLILHYIRMWDGRTSNAVDFFIANSQFISRRVRRVYGRGANVIYPPVDVDAFVCCDQKEDFYLTASRMVPYKKISLIVGAFARMPDKTLFVIGDGPELAKIQRLATSNVKILGFQSKEVLVSYMQRSKAFVFAAEEDFGITPVEAQACGTPVIAFGKGGALETVVESNDCDTRTGLFFDEQSEESIIDAVNRFEQSPQFISGVCRANAERFSRENFRHNFYQAVMNFISSSRVSGDAA